MGNFCPCLVPAPTTEIDRRRLVNTTIMVVGNLAVGKSSLIRCLVQGRSMKGVDIGKTERFDEDSITLAVPNKNCDVKIRFIDVAGDNSAVELIN